MAQQPIVRISDRSGLCMKIEFDVPDIIVSWGNLKKKGCAI